MATIPALLNPMDENNRYDSNEDSKDDLSTCDSQVSTVSDIPDNIGADKRSRKKQKMCKDAPVFKPGTIRGECRYPAHEDQDDSLLAKHELFEVYPLGTIASYPRHIPYNSEKKLYLDKTGRESFEVFQYQFKVPGDASTYTILWDYNIGLVRTTPLFKCAGYPKTTPAKMLARNEGLKDICHSITGGALVAQGYWIPYDAAKAVAATFCWNIRYALTPVFGKDFPDICVHPSSGEFGSMHIDPEITKRCTIQAQEYRDRESQAAAGPPSGSSSPPLPHSSKARPQLRKILPKHYTEADSASGWSTDSSNDDKYELSSPSPQVALGTSWSAINSPRSPSPKISFRNPWSPAESTRSASPHGTSRKGRTAAGIPRSHTTLDLLPPPRSVRLPPLETVTTPQKSHPGQENRENSMITETSPTSAVHPMDVDEDYDGGSDDSDSGKAGSKSSGRKKSSVFTQTNAAYVLMNLKTERVGVKADAKSLKRRASA